MNKFVYSAASLVLIAANTALAEVDDQQAAAPSVADRTASTALTDVVVTANRSAQQINRVGSSISILSKAALEAEQATSLPDTLARVPGISFTRNGGYGAVASVNIRGAESYHTVVVIDGVKMSDPSTTQGGINFSNLMVGDVGRIEILRGGQSTLWGSQAIGGVINIISAEASTPFEGSLGAEVGSRGTQVFRGAIGGVDDRLSWRLAANRFETDGFSAFATGTEDDGYVHQSYSGRINYALSDSVNLDLRGVYTDGENDFDAYNGDSREFAETKELVGYAGLNFDLFDQRLRNRIGYGYTNTDRTNLNPERSIAPETFEAEGTTKRYEYQGAFAFTETFSATFGLEFERAQMGTRSNPDSLLKPAFARSKADLDSRYVQLQWEALPTLNLTAGIRNDEHGQYGDATLGQVAAAWQLNDGKTVVRASWGEGFRAPSLYELYSDYGNLALQPEVFDTWELGFQHTVSDKLGFGLTYFNRVADNEIRYYNCSGAPDPLCTFNGNPRWGYYSNVQKTEAQGLEASATYNPISALQIVANYTWTEALNASGPHDGNQLVRRPEHMANLIADYRFASGFKTGIAARYSGKVFTNDANTATLDEYTLVDLRISYPVSETLEIYARVENLFDEKYQVVPDYGTAGRSAFGGVRVKF